MFMDISTREYNWGTVLELNVNSRGIMSMEDQRENKHSINYETAE
jgi:hypothetical protein